MNKSVIAEYLRIAKRSFRALMLCLCVVLVFADASFGDDMKDLKSALALINAFQQKHALPLFMQDDVKEITPKDAFAKAKLQVFKMRDYQSFVIRGDKAFPIGASFGGFGVSSSCIADLEGSGHPLLIYAYSWGSGLHRSELAAFDPEDGKQYPSPCSYVRMDDLTVASSNDGHHVDVIAKGTKIASVKSIGPDARYGKILEVSLNADAPDWAKQSFKIAPKSEPSP